MLENLIREIVDFRDERDWQQYHSARNLAASISIEAAELLELFQWSSDSTLPGDISEHCEDIQQEIADVLIYTLLLAHDLHIDPFNAVRNKLAENRIKYPVERARGRREKYTDL